MIETIFQYQTKRTISINELQTADYKEIDFKWADPAERNFLSNRDLLKHDFIESELFTEDKWPILELAREKKDKGVYLFVEITDNKNEVIPLYVGRTVSFLTRFNQYSRVEKSTWMAKYFKAQDEGEWDTSCCNIEEIYLWLEKDERKRMLLEHELISKFKPYYNKA